MVNLGANVVMCQYLTALVRNKDPKTESVSPLDLDIAVKDTVINMLTKAGYGMRDKVITMVLKSELTDVQCELAEFLKSRGIMMTVVSVGEADQNGRVTVQGLLWSR